MPSHEIFKNYPFVQKALREQEAAAQFSGDSVPGCYIAMIERTTAIAEEFLDGTPEEKEAVMVGCVLTTGSPFVFDDITRFETKYTPQIKDLVDDLVVGQTSFEENAPLQQIGAVLTLFSLEQQILSGITGPVEKDADVTSPDFKKNIMQMAPLLEETAPRLHAFLSKKIDEAIAAARMQEQASPRQDSGTGQKGPAFN